MYNALYLVSAYDKSKISAVFCLYYKTLVFVQRI